MSMCNVRVHESDRGPVMLLLLTTSDRGYMMSQYGNVAIGVVKKFLTTSSKGNQLNPVIEWINEAKLHITSQSSREKTCPKNAFLGLCKNGLVKGISPGKYVKSKENKKYAIEAVNILKNNPYYSTVSPQKLWEEVMNSLKLPITKTHNQQMNIVLDLWKSNYIT